MTTFFGLFCIFCAVSVRVSKFDIECFVVSGQKPTSVPPLGSYGTLGHVRTCLEAVCDAWARRDSKAACKRISLVALDYEKLRGTGLISGLDASRLGEIKVQTV